MDTQTPLRRFRSWYWMLVPALAVAAYVSVVGIDFLADDLWLLNAARNTGIDLTFRTGGRWQFYRPVGELLTWQMGWQLWGVNPVPYHLLGLMAHAATSLALGLWLWQVTGRRSP